MADITITPANVLKGASAGYEVGIAGETILAGQVLYLKTADSRLWKAQCDTTDEEAAAIGVALHGATAGQPVSYQTNGAMNIGATTVKTTHYVLSATAGGIAPQADLVGTNRIVFVGYATDTAGAFFVRISRTGAVV